VPPTLLLVISSHGRSTSSPTNHIQLQVWLLAVWHSYLARHVGTVCELRRRLQLLCLCAGPPKRPPSYLSLIVSVVLQPSRPDASAGASFLHALFAKPRQSAAGDGLGKKVYAQWSLLAWDNVRQLSAARGPAMWILWCVVSGQKLC